MYTYHIISYHIISYHIISYHIYTYNMCYNSSKCVADLLLLLLLPDEVHEPGLLPQD